MPMRWRTRSHQDVFCHVLDSAAPLDDAVMNDAKVVLQQHKISCLLCDVGSGVNGDADVSDMKCGSIVDAVAEEANNFAGAFQRQKDSLFLLRGNGKKVDRVQTCAHATIGHVRKFRSGKHAFDGNANLAAHVSRNSLVITGQDFDFDTE